MYDEQMVSPMRKELTDSGLVEARTAAEVDELIKSNTTVLAVINSVCGCAAANARPAVSLAMGNGKLPVKSFTVFAGNDAEAVAKLRENLIGYPPSSPNIALFKNGEVVCNIERHDIEGRRAEEIANDIIKAFDENC